MSSVSSHPTPPPDAALLPEFAGDGFDPPGGTWRKPTVAGKRQSPGPLQPGDLAGVDSRL